LDVFPLVKGHVLVVPKIEVDRIFDLPDQFLAAMLVFAKPIAKAIEKTMDCNRCGITVMGMEVPHAHMHLMPINSANDLNFTRPKLSLSEVEMDQIRGRIAEAI
jgi:histidine triad (HIT) family protein